MNFKLPNALPESRYLAFSPGSIFHLCHHVSRAACSFFIDNFQGTGLQLHGFLRMVFKKQMVFPNWDQQGERNHHRSSLSVT